MAMKVTAMTYLQVLKDFNVGQKRLYDMFVDISGFELDSFITKDQVKEYLNAKFNMAVKDSELNDFFNFVKKGSTDEDPERITAIEYYMNVHAYPIAPMFQNSLLAKIAALDPTVVSELDAWLKRINGVLDEAKKADVQLN